jgi:negative regulator of sigma E activity
VSRAAKVVVARIVALDGADADEQWRRGDRLELTPGRHSITLDLTENVVGDPTVSITLTDLVYDLMAVGANAVGAREARVFVVVNVEAGRRYLFVARVSSDGEATYEITDAETGAVVSG